MDFIGKRDWSARWSRDISDKIAVGRFAAGGFPQKTRPVLRYEVVVGDGEMVGNGSSGMIYADGMNGRFRLGYGAQFIHVAAAIAEDRAEIDRLVADGAAPNAGDAGGCTPLHYAAYNNPVGEVALALFEAGADPEACDGYGEKPLNYAVNAVNAAFIEAALDAGADPAGNGEALRDAETKVRLTCPAFGKTRAYRRLRLASALRD